MQYAIRLQEIRINSISDTVSTMLNKVFETKAALTPEMLRA
jgi:hypothetical protein